MTSFFPHCYDNPSKSMECKYVDNIVERCNKPSCHWNSVSTRLGLNCWMFKLKPQNYDSMTELCRLTLSNLIMDFLDIFIGCKQFFFCGDVFWNLINFCGLSTTKQTFLPPNSTSFISISNLLFARTFHRQKGKRRRLTFLGSSHVFWVSHTFPFSIHSPKWVMRGWWRKTFVNTHFSSSTSSSW